MEDIDKIARQYFLDIADTLELKILKYGCKEYEYLWNIFIEDARAGYYYTHFNFRYVNGDISLQPRTNIGKSIFDYIDRNKF